MKRFLTLVAAILLAACGRTDYDVIVVGGGASGTAAGLQSARLGANTLILEQTPWLGGMLTSAGVSAIDGCYRLRAGIFGEFCDSLAARYGGYDSLRTGWVSNILFEPHVGAQVLDNMCGAQKNLTVKKNVHFRHIRKCGGGWVVGAGFHRYVCKVLVDGTELGGVAKECGVKYETGDAQGIIQDLTWVIIAKDYGPGADKTIEKPRGYRQENYVNCCLNPLNDPQTSKGQTLWSPEMMMSYGRLPGGKIMLNWPIEGNDWYANVTDASGRERSKAYRDAKDKALGYLYFIQTELGMKNIGIADDEYPTSDGLPFFPYFRESRRIEGEARLTFDAVRDPYNYPEPLYRAGVAVGDYPVDHHHYAHPDWKRLHKSFTPIPSFTVPAGVMIPKGVENLIVAEKSISVDNSVQGATRLQPVVMELGQAAGVIAALAAGEDIPVREVDVRRVQTILLEEGARIQPYLDLEPGDPDFKLLQRMGSTGLFKAEGRNEGWAGEMWMLTGSDPKSRLDSIRLADSLEHPFETGPVDWRGFDKRPH
ncbi:MAG: FAD-dependent oxidoreductase [Bacteroidales bacterium]|nr:FAD-dependent oxidoreductase [Bacteroidales bacterium]